MTSNTDLDIYLTVQEAARLLRYDPETVQEKMRLGVFRQGVHFFKRKGMRPRFKKSALIAWVEGRDQPQPENAKAGAIPMRRGYSLELRERVR